MYRRLMFTMLLVVAIVSVSQFTWGASGPVDPFGEYAVVKGKTTLALDLVLVGKKLLNISVNLYDLSIVGLFGSLYFGPDSGTGGVFEIRAEDVSTEPVLSGTWSRTGPTSFSVDVNLELLLDQLNGYLEGSGLHAEENTNSYFTAKISSKGPKMTMSAKYDLVVDLVSDDEEINVAGTSLRFSGSFVAEQFAALAVSHAPTIANVDRASRIKDVAKSLAEQIRRETVRAGQN